MALSDKVVRLHLKRNTVSWVYGSYVDLALLTDEQSLCICPGDQFGAGINRTYFKEHEDYKNSYHPHSGLVMNLSYTFSSSKRISSAITLNFNEKNADLLFCNCALGGGASIHADYKLPYLNILFEPQWKIFNNLPLFISGGPYLGFRSGGSREGVEKEYGSGGVGPDGTVYPSYNASNPLSKPAGEDFNTMDLGFSFSLFAEIPLYDQVGILVRGRVLNGIINTGNRDNFIVPYHLNSWSPSISVGLAYHLK